MRRDPLEQEESDWPSWGLIAALWGLMLLAGWFFLTAHEIRITREESARFEREQADRDFPLPESPDGWLLTNDGFEASEY
jgi:hypothetical protein